MNVLILCTGNSARSIIGEAIASSLPDVHGFSAGSHPKDVPHPMAIAVLKAKGHDISSLRSKSWDEFSAASAREMDVVITVCDNAAGETCPVWHGHPVQVHWGLPDPATVEEMNFQRAAFEDTYSALKSRLSKLAKLDLRAMDSAERRAAIQAIHPAR
ncbi:MAG: arsenate reductase ArsC [Pseudomonadota bacterium]